MRYETPKAEITLISSQDILMLSGDRTNPGTDNTVDYNDIMNGI